MEEPDNEEPSIEEQVNGSGSTLFFDTAEKALAAIREYQEKTNSQFVTIKSRQTGTLHYITSPIL